MRTKIIVAALALMLASIPAIVQGAPFDHYKILVNTLKTPQGQIELRQIPGSFTNFDGMIDGDPLQGFFATWGTGRQIVWVRFSGGVASQVYVGTYTEIKLVSLPRHRLEIVSREIRGNVYALNAAGGASPNRNAFGFRAWNSSFQQPRGVLPWRNPNPANSLNALSAPQSAGAWWVTTNAQSAMVLEVEMAGGAVTGWLFGDPIRGHYAAAAGTISFVRLQNDRAIQLYHGVSVRAPVPRFDGAQVTLNSEGGASEYVIDYPLTATNKSTFFITGPVANDGRRCVEFGINNVEDGRPLVLATCAPTEKSQNFALVSTAANGPTVMVARHSGRCLDIPYGITTPGQQVQQFLCHGAPNQQVARVRSQSCPPNFPGCFLTRFSLISPVCLKDNGAGRIVTEDCSVPQTPEIQFLDRPVFP